MNNYYEMVFDVPLAFGTPPFTYSGGVKGDPAVGKRAVCQFGRREMVGFIIGETDVPPAGVPPEKIKPIRRLVDKEPVFGADEIALAKWVADFYFCTHGEALSAMIPSGRRPSGFASFTTDDLDLAAANEHGLSGEQQAALDAIVPQTVTTDGVLRGVPAEGVAKDAAGGCSEGETSPHNQYFYLYGITGSGKTEVFLKAAQRILDAGRSVIYLVPEIALTHQTAEAIGRRFGPQAATLHSAMSGQKRLDEWMRIKRGEARIVVGPRSAVFAPVRDLGLVIIDEEHDGSYKSGNTPRYHGRQVAMHRCAQVGAGGAVLVMGSATPSAEAWKLMADGAIRRLDLTRRLSGGSMPRIKPVDLGATDGCLTYELKQEIRATAAAGRQTILFLNRRGFAYFYRCPSCGFELKCKHCSVALTWHKSTGRVVCHYCGWQTPPPAACPQCGSMEAGFKGFGTELIEEELHRTFPDLRVRRLDADTASKTKPEETMALFKNHGIDILVGTQMVAKGLNFPGVRLVGVIFADTGLQMPDFRAAERTFSLIVQVAGRAGRFFPDGKVIVQTLRPNDPLIKRACALDLEGFYTQELEMRKMMAFPPWSRLIRITVRSKEAGRAETAIGHIFNIASPLLPRDADCLGPAECPIELLNGSHRRHIILRGRTMSTLHTCCRQTLLRYEPFHDAKVHLEVDVDPVNVM
ncbi:primosomal protein N' [Spirochaetia bacterium]|nr:primosomal protein N' [Spirochaetia bacterium]